MTFLVRQNEFLVRQKDRAQLNYRLYRHNLNHTQSSVTDKNMALIV
jgi:hypothetical protein